MDEHTGPVHAFDAARFLAGEDVEAGVNWEEMIARLKAMPFDVTGKCADDYETDRRRRGGERDA